MIELLFYTASNFHCLSIKFRQKTYDAVYIVYYKADLTGTSDVPESVIVVAGSDKILECQTSGNNTYIWDFYKPEISKSTPFVIYNGRNLNDALGSVDYDVRSDSTRNTSSSRLTLLNVTLKHAGTYQCKFIKDDTLIKQFHVEVLGEFRSSYFIGLFFAD